MINIDLINCEDMLVAAKLVSRQGRIGTIMMLTVLLTLVCTQKLTDLTLNEPIKLELKPGATVIYKLMLPTLKDNEQDLYIQIQSPVNDPYQIPFVKVSSADYLQNCDQSRAEFTGICMIPSNSLVNKTEFDVTITCFQGCHLEITAYLSHIIQVDFQTGKPFRGAAETGSIFELQLQIPQNAKYTKLAIQAKIINMGEVLQSLQLRANVGKQDLPMPTLAKSSYQAISSGQSGKAIYLTPTDAPPGSFIKILLILSPGMRVLFESNTININNRSIIFGSEYLDFGGKGQVNIYTLELKTYLAINADRIVVVGLYVYSGKVSMSLSFHEDMSNPLPITPIINLGRYSLTPELRLQYNYVDTVYIAINCQTSSDYKLESHGIFEKYITLHPQLTEYISNTQKQMQQFLYSDTVIVNLTNKQTTVLDYTVKVEMIEGTGRFGVRRCKQYEDDFKLDCLINTCANLTELQKKRNFNGLPIYFQNTQSTFYLLFSNDVSVCKQTTRTPTLVTYFCVYQIVTCNHLEKDMQYDITMIPRRYSSQLQQGKIVKDTLSKGNYMYYFFSLTDTTNIEFLTFFTTMIEGSVALMVSTDEKYPRTDRVGSKGRLTTSNSILFFHNELEKVYYVGLYASEMATFTLGVLIKREQTASNESAHDTQITMRENVGQLYTLQVTEKVDFLIHIKTSIPKNYTVQVDELNGNVKLTPINMAENWKCVNSRVIQCSFLAKDDQTYIVSVINTDITQAKFIITYYSYGDCLNYPLNSPLFVVLTARQVKCIKVPLTNFHDLQISVSLSNLQYMQQQVTVQFCMRNNCQQVFDVHHHIIDKKQLLTGCGSGLDNIQECAFKVVFLNRKEVVKRFYAIVETSGSEMVLFDGIVEKVMEDGLSQTNGRYLSYTVHETSSIKIFFTIQTMADYYFIAHFVNDSVLFSQKYLQYNPKFQYPEDSYHAHIEFSYRTLTIPTVDLRKNCKQNCVLAIAIYSTSTQPQLAEFEVEVTQDETYLFHGDYKTGFLLKDQVYTYSLFAGSKGESLLVVRDLGKQSKLVSNCFTATLSEQGNMYEERDLKLQLETIFASNKSYELTIRAVKAHCSYQVSYTYAQTSLISLVPQLPQEVHINSMNQRKYFLYYHTYAKEFKIVESILAGNSVIYATPLNNEDLAKSVDQAINGNLTDFAYTRGYMHAELKIDKQNDKFCEKCYYLIAVVGNVTVRSEIVVLDANAPTQLTVYGMLKDTIGVQNKSYVFYSANSFNISLSMLYGQLSVKVINPKNKTVIDKTISHTQVLQIISQVQSLFEYSYPSKDTKYSIEVYGQQNSSYTLQVKKTQPVTRISQGFSLFLQLNKTDVNKQLEYLCIDSSTDIITVMIELIRCAKNDVEINRKSEYCYVVDVNIAVMILDETGVQKKSPTISRNRSENSINFKIEKIVGIYVFILTSTTSIDLNFLLVRNQLTHILPLHNNLFTHEGIFQLYSPMKSVMIEVFNCVGQISVQASRLYPSGNQSINSIFLQQINYGGHYVIAVENVFGQYYLKTTKQLNESVMYMITYFFYEQNDVLPYKRVKMPVREIEYKIDGESMKFVLQPVQVDFTGTKVVNYTVTYRLYVAFKREHINLFAKCSIGTIYQREIVEAGTVPIVFDIKVQYMIAQKTDIKALVDYTDVYYVGASVIVSLQSAEGGQYFPKELDLIYETIEITSVNGNPYPGTTDLGKSKFELALIVVIPLVVAMILMLLALRYCIKRYRGAVPTSMVEEQMPDYGSTEDKLGNKGSADIKIGNDG